MNQMIAWFENRWAEPESRAAVAVALTMLGGVIKGDVTPESFGLAMFGAVMAFILPRQQGVAK